MDLYEYNHSFTLNASLSGELGFGKEEYQKFG
jgi:hypothetical protein